MKITVILCTYNRCQKLGKTLEGVVALRLPESDEWEVLVVDNNYEQSDALCGGGILPAIPRSLPVSI